MKLPLAIFSLLSSLVFAHKNTQVEKVYGNIAVLSSTAYETEAINKNFIIAQYAGLLSKRLSYLGKIMLYLSERNETTFKIWQKDPEETDLIDLHIYIFSPAKDPAGCKYDFDREKYFIAAERQRENRKSARLRKLPAL